MLSHFILCFKNTSIIIISSSSPRVAFREKEPRPCQWKKRVVCRLFAVTQTSSYGQRFYWIKSRKLLRKVFVFKFHVFACASLYIVELDRTLSVCICRAVGQRPPDDGRTVASLPLGYSANFKSRTIIFREFRWRGCNALVNACVWLETKTTP